VIDTTTNTVVTEVSVGTSPSAFGKFIGPVQSAEFDDDVEIDKEREESAEGGEFERREGRRRDSARQSRQPVRGQSPSRRSREP
jgi:hypothetical protein